MVRLDINPLHDKSLDCLEDCIVTILKWLKIDYECLFLGLWEFELDNSQDKEFEYLSDRIKLGIFNNDILGKCLGINLSKNNSISKCIDFVKNNINQKTPVLVYLNDFYISYTKEYKRVDHYHYYIAIGYDSLKKEILLIDPYYEKSDYLMSESDFEKAISEQYIMVFTRDTLNEINWKSVLYQAVTDSKRKYMFEFVKNLADFIKEDFDFKKEFYGVKNPRLIVLIDLIAHSRISLAVSLDYIASVTQNKTFNYLADELRKLDDKWTMLINILRKSMFTNNYNGLTVKVMNILKEISSEEEKLYDEMDKLVSSIKYELEGALLC